jgi:hypothetical protein
MPRRPMVFIEGPTYHVYNRVGRGEAAHMRHAIDRLNTYLAPFTRKNSSTRIPSKRIIGTVTTTTALIPAVAWTRSTATTQSEPRECVGKGGVNQ